MVVAQFLITRGVDAGKRVRISQFPISIGRDPSNEIVLDDTEVSRIHSRIKQRGRLFIIEDCDSRNGSYVNGDKIVNSTLQNGDKILFGSTELTFMTAAPDIQVAGELTSFDMVISEYDGIKGPIQISKHDKDHSFSPIRLNQVSVINQLADDLRGVKSIYDHHGHIVIQSDLEEASKLLLKSIGQIVPTTSRAAFFLWNEPNRQLVPIATKHFNGDKTPFLLSQRSFEDALARHQGILLNAQSKNVTQAGRTRVVIPIIHLERVVGLLHLESDQVVDAFQRRALDLVQALISRSAPSFDSLLMRQELDSWMVGMVETMVATIEAKDTYTFGHSERVCRYSLAIGDELKLTRDIRKQLMISSLCHDIGKIGIPDSILKKASFLSNEEYQEMKQHPEIGADIINNMPNAQRFLSGIKYHHERWDGTGYPDGLAGEEIPFFGRIVAVSDAFDAMVSGRSYSGFMDETEAVEKLEKEAELFDPEILKAFFKAWDNGRLTQRTSTKAKHEDS